MIRKIGPFTGGKLSSITIAMRQENYKLIHHVGFTGYKRFVKDKHCLTGTTVPYDIEDDLEKLHNHHAHICMEHILVHLEFTQLTFMHDINYDLGNALPHNSG